VGIDHYIAQFHQRFFAADPDVPSLHVYHKQIGYVGFEPIKRIGQETDLFTAEVDDWMKKIEGRAAKAMQDLVEGGLLRDADRMSHLLDYVALTVVRNLSHLRGWERFLDEVSQEHPEYTEQWLEEVSREGTSARLRDFIFPRIRPTLDLLKWSKTTYRSDPTLVLGDNPVVYNAVRGNWLPNRWSFVLMPISPGLVLCGYKNSSMVEGILCDPLHVNALSFDWSEHHFFSGSPLTDKEFEAIRQEAARLPRKHRGEVEVPSSITSTMRALRRRPTAQIRRR
jgi:uncharacterized protein DUF4238